jgi:hypothetical protein
LPPRSPKLYLTRIELARNEEKSMPGIKIVYVTRTGHARALAESIASLSGGGVAEIGDPSNRKGIFGFLKSGGQASKGSGAPFVDPRVDLSGASAVALVQPLWASSVCPPLRSWIKAHKAELKGKKIGLFVTARASSGDPIRAKFEAEFGPLDAFALVREKDDEASRSRAIEGFVAALN